MKKFLYTLLIFSATSLTMCAPEVEEIDSTDERLTFVGRTDFSSGNARQWASGAYFSFAFNGTGCELDIVDEVLYGSNYNYLEIVVDSLAPRRIRTSGRLNTVVIGQALTDVVDSAVNVVQVFENLTDTRHTVEVVRDTETGMGFTELTKIRALGLENWSRPTEFTIEFIGNSITCGAESYLDEVAAGEGSWFDRHMAYNGYGPRTARALGARWLLTSCSGIGLVHSCCDMEIVMPQVYDKIILRDNKLPYDFAQIPDVVCICLGQNDGRQPDDVFVAAYVDFIATIRSHYADAKIVLLTSPMADETLTAWMQQILPAVATTSGDDKVSTYFFSRSFNSGGGGHPDVNEHAQIADELVAYLRTIL